MNYIYYKGNLTELLGRENAIKITLENKELGVGKVTQLLQEETHSFIELIDENNEFVKSLGSITVLTKDEANTKITEIFVPNYIITNEVLMSANINQLVTAGTLDLTSFDGAWDEQLELKELYKNHNVSGITESVAPTL